MTTCIIADDHPFTLEGMKTYVQKLGYTVLNTFDNGICAYNNLISLKPDYAILDLSMPGMNGMEILEKIREQNKTIKIIIYTMYNETTLFDMAVELGVNGYILKEFATEELEICLETLQHQKEWFSPKLKTKLVIKTFNNLEDKYSKLTAGQRKIVQLIAQGLSTKQIAEGLFISVKTVENHRGNIIKKLGLQNSQHALYKWSIGVVGNSK